MYGKVMSVPDKGMPLFFRLVTRWTPPEIAELESGLKTGRLHPRDVKMKLAREIVEIYHGPQAALQAEEAFVRVFQQKDIPAEMPEYVLQNGQSVLEVLVSSGLASSKGEARRLLQQNGVRLDGTTLTDPNQVFPQAGVLQVGKRHFIRVSEKT
jgi:tyrosyl-tRNA synthetase